MPESTAGWGAHQLTQGRLQQRVNVQQFGSASPMSKQVMPGALALPGNGSNQSSGVQRQSRAGYGSIMAHTPASVAAISGNSGKTATAGFAY
jgi:hypothetical protein